MIIIGGLTGVEVWQHVDKDSSRQVSRSGCRKKRPERTTPSSYLATKISVKKPNEQLVTRRNQLFDTENFYQEILLKARLASGKSKSRSTERLFMVLETALSLRELLWRHNVLERSKAAMSVPIR